MVIMAAEWPFGPTIVKRRLDFQGRKSKRLHSTRGQSGHMGSLFTSTGPNHPLILPFPGPSAAF